MNWMLSGIGQRIARYLQHAEEGYEPFTPSDPDALARGAASPATCCWSKATAASPASSNTSPSRPGRMPRSTSARSASAPPSTASRWCWSRPTSAKAWSARRCRNIIRYHTRICRPIGLTEDDRARVCTYAAERIGFDYDVKNIFDLLRYLCPLPVPQRWRRRMMSLGSGHPTRIICSALIAQAFEHVHYPILPKVTRLESEAARRDILEIRHSSLYAPRDFDISPYFQLVKPTIERGFDYRRMAWAHLPHTHEPCRPRRCSSATPMPDADDAEAAPPAIAPAH